MLIVVEVGRGGGKSVSGDPLGKITYKLRIALAIEHF
jgi:hypothetical protein